MRGKKLLQTGFIVAAGVAGWVLLEALWLERYFFKVKKYKIGAAAARQRKRILLLADLHFVDRLWWYYRRLAAKINRLQPDIILIAGDTLDQNGDVEVAKRFFRLLKFGVPKIAIPGNHDHRNPLSIGSLKKFYDQFNGQLLVNATTSVLLGDLQLTITGLDDMMESEGKLRKAVQNVGKEPHHFLLIHNPSQQEGVLKELETINSIRAVSDKIHISYIFAGHNHGGQVRFKTFVPFLPERDLPYLQGWFNKTNPLLYVSKGFGTTTNRVPFRFGVRSEISVMEYGYEP